MKRKSKTEILKILTETWKDDISFVQLLHILGVNKTFNVFDGKDRFSVIKDNYLESDEEILKEIKQTQWYKKFYG